MSKKVSLKQFLMRTGRFDKAYSAESEIRNGKITLNNEKIDNPNHFFNPRTSIVKYNGEKLSEVKLLYFAFNKPLEYVCQKSKNEKTVYEFIGKLDIDDFSKKSLFAVGRLDKDTEGLLIITNDGKLSSILTQPNNGIPKEYYVSAEKPINKAQIKSLEKGVTIKLEEGDYTTREAKVNAVDENSACIIITEGKKRQVRRMLEALGNKVTYLKRTAIGHLKLGGLKKGQFRQFSREEMYGQLGLKFRQRL